MYKITGCVKLEKSNLSFFVLCLYRHCLHESSKTIEQSSTLPAVEYVVYSEMSCKNQSPCGPMFSRMDQGRLRGKTLVLAEHLCPSMDSSFLWML